MKPKLVFILIVLMAFLQMGYAQDLTYSQYHSSDLTLNPALTGLSYSDWQVGDLFHSGKSLNNNRFTQNNLYGTYKIALDKKNAQGFGLVTRDEKNKIIGIGFINQILNTDAGDVGYTTNHLSIGYHYKIIDKLYLSAGIQPGLAQSNGKNKFDLNLGILAGYGQVNCWQEDQYSKYQAGLSFYHVTREKTTDAIEDSISNSLPFARKIHGGALFKLDNIGIHPDAFWLDNGNTIMQAGINLVFLRHFKNSDRWRIGVHYKNTKHLVLSGGFRIFGSMQSSFSGDLSLSYDVPLRNHLYKSVFEIGLILMPLKKCWYVQGCSNR